MRFYYIKIVHANCIWKSDLNWKAHDTPKNSILKQKKDAEVELSKFVTEISNSLVIDGKSLKFPESVEIWKRDYVSKNLHQQHIEDIVEC